MPNRPRVGASLLTAAAMVAVAVVAVTALQDRGGSGGGAITRAAGEGHPRLDSAAAGLAPPATPAFAVPTPHPLRLSNHAARWAPVVRAVAARARPRSGARIVANVGTRTPEGTTNIVLATGARRDRAHSLWVHVRLPILPNNSRGWVPRAALGGYRFVRTHLVVDLHALQATLYRGRRAVFRAPVGVGASGTATPVGTFYIRDRLTRYASPFYGPIAFGTSARSPVLTDWPAGGYIGIHGTNRPDLIPGRISHGCIRLRNADIRRLATLMPVGTPLTVERGR